MGDETVRVVVRCRPFNSREISARYGACVRVSHELHQIELIKSNEDANPDKSFTFDAVYDVDSTQHQVFMDVGYPMVNSIMEGYNGTIFAYGQTGCGKTFTMEGLPSPVEMRGVIPSCFSRIFACIANDPDRQFLVSASYIEIYNEEVRDLIGDDPKAKLDLKESPDKGVFVQGLTQNVVTNVDDIDALQKKGNKCRSIGFTKMNADSSRSHSIFIIRIEGRETDPGTGRERIRAGKLNLVDLAGSERQSKTAAEGARLKEATKINLSLSALGNVISALTSSTKNKHIPYRDSKLTRLLQDSLGGNTRTVMLAAISPSEDAYDETLTTLRYANRTKNIKNKPVVNEDPKDTMLRQYQEEITRLKTMLERQQVLPITMEIGDQAEVPTVAMSNDEIQRLKQEFIEQHEVKARDLEADRERTVQLQQRLQQEWELVQEERNAIAIHRKTGSIVQIEEPDEELINAQYELEIAMDQNAERGAVLDSQLLDVMNVIEIEDKMTVDEFKQIIDAKEQEISRTEAESQMIQAQLQEQYFATEAEKKRLEESLALLESQVIAGGQQVQNVKAQHEMELMEAERRIIEQQQQQETLAQEKRKADEEKILLQEHFGSLQEEVETSRDKLKALQAKYTSALSENEDLQKEFERERDEALEIIRVANRDVELYKTIVTNIISGRALDKVIRAAKWDEDEELWSIPKSALSSCFPSQPIPDSSTMKFSKRDDTIDTDSNGFSNLNAPASSNTRRKPRSTSGQRKTTNDDRFAEDRRKIVSSETRSCLLSKLDQTMPIRSTPIPAPIKRWSRSQSVLNQITNSDFDAPPTSATNILENFLKELPPRNRATFVVANTVSLNEKSVNDRTVNPNIPDTVMKPKFEPAARVSSQMAKANEPSIIDVLNKPLTMKKAFEPNMKVEDKTRQTTPTKGTRKDEDPAAILIPTKPIADKPKFLPNRAGIDNEKNCDKEPIGLIPTEPLARPNFQPGRFHK